MFYNHKLLNTEEKTLLFCLITQYKGYDKLDILIERIIVDPQEFLSRKPKKVIKEEVIVQKMDESLKFCDGDKCSIF